MKEKYKVSGMSCAACSARVERAVSGVTGVDSCEVNLLTAEMTVEGAATAAAIEAAVSAAGYSAKKIGNENGAQIGTGADELRDTESPMLLKRLIASLGFLALLMYVSMGYMLGAPLPDILTANPVALGLIQLLLSAAVLVINQKFFISGVRGIINRAPNMDTLVSLGSAVSFGYSVYLLFEMSYAALGGIDASHYLHGLYFESAAMILALITLGKFLEAKAKGKTTDALKGLLSLRPRVATVLRLGEEIEIPIDELRVGDEFIVRAGDSVPTDGVVISGDGSVDESALTGESVPEDKSAESRVYGATVCRSGYMICRATEVGEGTAIAGIIRMVKDASSSKAPIAKLADKVSGVFVPVVMTIALITLVGWLMAGAGVGYAIARAISVLVISCPCALGLATPVAIMVGSGVGARRGILFKNATALEVAGRISTVVLDKTGTVTRGEMSVTDVIAFGSLDELLTVAFSLEYMSEHPLGAAVVRYAEDRSVQRREIEAFKTLAGRGVSGILDKEEIFGVSFEYAKTLINVDKKTENSYISLATGGKTPLVFIKGKRVLGIIAVADTLKEDAVRLVDALRTLGVRVVMLTGDNELTARAIASEAGIDEVIAGVMPDGKERVIRELSESGRVAMVGDGINDAPALTRADLGIAVGRGTDIAIDAADVVLVADRLTDVASALGIGRSTLTNIKENLVWAFLYNCIGIPMAAGLFGLALDPMFGALAMSLSSFSVVMNALRLNFFKPKHERGAELTKNEPLIQLNNANETEKIDKMTKLMKVNGMMCPHCEARVKKVLEAIEGVDCATPSHKDGTVEVVLRADVAPELLSAAVTDAGYEVTEIV